jgi:hypothetical protein
VCDRGCAFRTLADAVRFSGPGDTVVLRDRVHAPAARAETPWVVLVPHALVIDGDGATLRIPAETPVGIAVAADHVTIKQLRVERVNASERHTANVALVCSDVGRYGAYRPHDPHDAVDAVLATAGTVARGIHTRVASASIDAVGEHRSALDVLAGRAAGEPVADAARCVLSHVRLERVVSRDAATADIVVLGRAAGLDVSLTVVESALASGGRHAVAASRTAALKLAMHESEVGSTRREHVRVDGASTSVNVSYCYWDNANDAGEPRVVVRNRRSRDAAAVVTHPVYTDSNRRSLRYRRVESETARVGRVVASALLGTFLLFAIFFAIALVTGVFAARARRARWVR